jgi:hypothetical protein
MHSRLILNYQIHSGRSDLSHDIGLLRLQKQLSEHRLTLDDIGSQTLPPAVADLSARWQRACCRRIARSVRLLLSFVSFKSVVVSSYAPSALGERVCSRLHQELPELDFIFGANSMAPKAVGAASLPYHSRFMVQ